MKFLKGLVKTILVFVLFNVIMVLSFSFVVPKFISNGIIRDIIAVNLVDKYVLKNVSNQEKEAEDNVDVSSVLGEIGENEDVKKLFESSDAQELLTKYYNIFIDGLAGDEDLQNVNIEEDLLNFLVAHREELQKISNEEITDERIEEIRQGMRQNDVNGNFVKIINDTKSDTPEITKTVLNGFKYFISDAFRLILIVVIAIDILLMALIDFALSKTFKSVGWCMITSGILFLIFGFGFNFLLGKLIEVIGEELSLSNPTIDTSSLVITGSILLVGGIILCIISMIIKVIFKKKNDNKTEKNSNNNIDNGGFNNTNNNTYNNVSQVVEDTNQISTNMESNVNNNSQESGVIDNQQSFLQSNDGSGQNNDLS